MWDVDQARRELVADRLGARVPISLEHALSCDAVITVTPGQSVLFPAGSLQDGQHVSLMGADGPGKAEVAVDELERAHLFCDDWEQASHGGELAAGVAAGVVTRDAVTELGAMLAGNAEDAAARRTSPCSTPPGSRSKIWRSPRRRSSAQAI